MPFCKTKSKGEKITSIFLKNNNINFEIQKTFSDLKNKKLLRFDFYLPKNNILLEIDGEEHIRPVNFGGISDEDAQRNFLNLKKMIF